jgi:hypothetical protein
VVVERRQRGGDALQNFQRTQTMPGARNWNRTASSIALDRCFVSFTSLFNSICFLSRRSLGFALGVENAAHCARFDHNTITEYAAR